MAFNAFVGYKLSQDLFIEAGYETHKAKHKTARVGEGDYLPVTSEPVNY